MCRKSKAILSLLLVLTLLVGVVPAFAEEAAVPNASVFARMFKSVKLSSKSAKYDGDAHVPTVKVTAYGNEKLGKDLVLVAGQDYKVKMPKDMTSAGLKRIKVYGKGLYTGSKAGLWFRIKKVANPFTIDLEETGFEYNADKEQVVDIGLVGLMENANVTWKSSKPSKVWVENGKLHIAKGFKGSARIAAVAATTKDYKKTKRSIKIKVTKPKTEVEPPLD